MTPDLIFEALESARDGLRACLNEFEAVSVSDPKAGRSFSLVQDAFAALGDLSELKNKVPTDEQDRLRSKLEELLRLNALLSEVVRKDKEGIGELLTHSQKALQSLKAMPRGDQGSSTCDVRA